MHTQITESKRKTNKREKKRMTHSFRSEGYLDFDLKAGLSPSRHINLAASSGVLEENGGAPSII